jgi:hypothetical protein
MVPLLLFWLSKVLSQQTSS